MYSYNFNVLKLNQLTFSRFSFLLKLCLTRDIVISICVVQVGSRQVFVLCGIIYIAFGLVGKFSAVFITIPHPVLGGALIVMFGMFIGVVLSNLQYVNLTSTRNLAIIGLSVIMGLAVPYWVEKTPDGIQTGAHFFFAMMKV